MTALPDISNKKLSSISFAKQLSNPESMKLADALFSELDPQKPILITFSAKLCEPCKFVKEASKLLMTDPEFKDAREKYNMVQINDMNDNDSFEFSYIDKDGNFISNIIDENPKFDNDFQKKFKPLFIDFATTGEDRSASTPTMGFLTINPDGSFQVKRYNIDPLVNDVDPNTSMEFGRNIAQRFLKDLNAVNK